MRENLSHCGGLIRYQTRKIGKIAAVGSSNIVASDRPICFGHGNTLNWHTKHDENQVQKRERTNKIYGCVGANNSCNITSTAIGPQ